MRYTTKKILPYVTLPIILSLPIHSSLAAETLTITEGVKQRLSEGALQTESGPVKPLNHETPTLPETAPSRTWQQSLKAATGMPWMFVTSLLDPFINDAPKILEALKNEGKKLKEQGVIYYTTVLGKHAGKVVADNPLDSVIMTGAMALGWTNVAEYSTIVPLTVGVAGGVKNGKAIYEFAASMDGKTVLTKGLQIGLYGAAIYVATSLPVSYALSTVTLGPEFQINQNALSTGTPSATAGLTDGTVVVSWPNSANTIVARIFYPNGTAITSEFDVSATATSSQVTPSVAGLTGGNWIATWQGGTTTILSRIFSPTGTAITSAFPTNQISTYTAMGSPVVTGLANGNALLSWYANSAGDYEIPGRIFYPNGTAITPEFNINQVTTNSQVAPFVTGLTDGTALVTWYSSSTGNYNILGRIFYQNGTAMGNEFTVNQAITPLGSPSVAGLTGGNAMVVYSSGNSQILGRIIQNGAPIGSEVPIQNGTTNVAFPSVAGLTDGNSLVAWQNGTVVADLFSSNGMDQSGDIVIPNYSIYGAGGPLVAALSNGDAFISWEDQLHNLYGRTISFSPSPTPSVSPSVSPTTTPTPPTTGGTPTPTSMPTSSPSVTPSPTTGFPTPSMMPTPTVTPVPSPATGTPMPSVTPSPYPSSTTTGMPSPASPSPVPSAGYTLKPGLLLLPVSIISSIFDGVATMVQSFWKYPS